MHIQKLNLILMNERKANHMDPENWQEQKPPNETSGNLKLCMFEPMRAI